MALQGWNYGSYYPRGPLISTTYISRLLIKNYLQLVASGPKENFLASPNKIESCNNFIKLIAIKSIISKEFSATSGFLPSFYIEPRTFEQTRPYYTVLSSVS